MAVHPVSRNVYITAMRGRWAGAQSVLLRVTRDADIEIVELDDVMFSTAAIPNAPASDPAARRNPRTFTVTDLAFADGRVWVAGLSNEEFSSAFRQMPFPFGDGMTTTGILGRYALTDDGIRFTPRFAPVVGQPWEVRYAPAHGVPVDTVLLVAADSGSVATRIVAVDPGIDTVPMNLLRAYVRFSAPMSEGEAYDRIRLLDAHGDTVADAFLVLEHERWDPERTRFTLLFDSGRIKRGLVPNEALGLPLREGNDYTLVIDGGWSDANGRALGAGYRWSFHAGPADRTSPRVEEWTIVSPCDRDRYRARGPGRQQSSTPVRCRPVGPAGHGRHRRGRTDSGYGSLITRWIA
jgi:hypothetical protein